MKKGFYHSRGNLGNRLPRFFWAVTLLVVAITLTENLHFTSVHPWWQIKDMTAFAQQPAPTPTVDRLAIPVLPENPTKIDIGRNVYYYNCMPCHGDIGQGLTDEWREVWVDDHQNCWAHGCHAGSETDLGFPIPTFVPAVIGTSAAMYHFQTEDDLYTYLSQEHPPQRPGALKADESRAVTAFLVSENARFYPGLESDPETNNNILLYIAGVCGLFGLFLLLLYIIRRERKKNSTETDGTK